MIPNTYSLYCPDHNKSQLWKMVKFCQGRVSKVLYSSSFFSLYISGLAESKNWGQKRKKNTKEEKSFWWVPDVFTHGKMMWSHMVLVNVAGIDKVCPEIIMQIFAIGGWDQASPRLAQKRSASTEAILEVNKKIANFLRKCWRGESLFTDQ